MTDFAGFALHDFLNVQNMDRIRSLAIRRSYRDGEVVQERGDVANSVGIVLSGQLRLVHLAPGGQELMLVKINPGQCYGEAQMFGSHARTHRAIAIGDTVIDHLPQEAFIKSLEDHDILMAFYRITLQRMLKAIELFDDIRTLSPEVRLAKLLVIMRDKAGGDKVQCNQADLADLIGVTTVTLAKALAVLKRENLLVTGYRHVTIPDHQRLKEWITLREAD